MTFYLGVGELGVSNDDIVGFLVIVKSDGSLKQIETCSEGICPKKTISTRTTILPFPSIVTQLGSPSRDSLSKHLNKSFRFLILVVYSSVIHS